MREGDGRRAREREGKEERNRGVRGEGEGGREGGRRAVSLLCVLLYNVHVCTYLSLCNHPVCIVRMRVVLCMECKVFESEREPCRVVTLYTCLHLEPSQLAY